MQPYVFWQPRVVSNIHYFILQCSVILLDQEKYYYLENNLRIDIFNLLIWRIKKHNPGVFLLTEKKKKKEEKAYECCAKGEDALFHIKEKETLVIHGNPWRIVWLLWGFKLPSWNAVSIINGAQTSVSQLIFLFLSIFTSKT